MGWQFFSQLRAARDALGLQFRFEMIFDDGNSPLEVSRHFCHRIHGNNMSSYHGSGCHGSGCQANQGSDVGHVTYADLEDIPCIVMMVGEERAHVTLPTYVRREGREREGGREGGMEIERKSERGIDGGRE